MATREKYPRTSHLPWSPGITNEDRVMADVGGLLRTELIMTEKMDGANVCLEREAVFARSHNEAPRHASFHALKALHASICYQIPASWQVFGEWLWARHSIAYNRLPAYLLLFGIRDQAQNAWLSWEEGAAWCQEQGLALVPVLWQGVCRTEEELHMRVCAVTHQPAFSDEQEGIVVRVRAGFSTDEFAFKMAKWVRPQHVQTTEQWRSQKIVRNLLAS